MRILIAVLLYLFFPLLVIYICYRSQNWVGLFAIVAYFAGLIMAMYRQWIFFPIPLVFCGWFWYTYGFSPTHYVSIFFLSFIIGAFFYETYRYIDRLFRSVLPEKFSNLDYNEKVDELNRRIEKFKREHPDEKLTSEVIEKIRTEIFFQ